MPAAFTLLEVLLAVAVFGIVLVAIHGVFYAGLRLRNKAAQTFDAAIPLQQALGIMKRDLDNIVLPGGTFFGELQTTSTNTMGSGQLGQSAATPTLGAILQGLSSPAFYTASGIISENLPWGEVEKVYYYLAEPTNYSRGKDLMRSVTRNLLPVMQEEPEDQFLMAGVENLLFSFYDGNQWLETWDSSTATTKLPAAIRVQIQLTPEETEPVVREPIVLVVPVMVQASTNATAQAEATSGGGG